MRDAAFIFYFLIISVFIISAIILRGKFKPPPVNKRTNSTRRKLMFSSLNYKEADAFIASYIRRNNLVKYAPYPQLKKLLLEDFDQANPQLLDKLTETEEWKECLEENVRDLLKIVSLPDGEYWGIQNGETMHMAEKDTLYFHRVRGFSCPTFFIVKGLRVVYEEGMKHGISHDTSQIKAIQKRLNTASKKNTKK